jgi:hypothetical protein
MKKQLTEEIGRIKEVMGINESVINPLIDISKRIARSLSSVNLSKNLNLENAYTGFQKAVRSGNSSDYFRYLSDMLDEMPSLYDNQIKKLLMDHNKVLIDDLETQVNNYLAKGYNKDTIKKVVNKFIKEKIQKEFPYDRFSKDLQNKFDDTIDNYRRPMAPLNPDLEPNALKKLLDNFPALQTFVRMTARWWKTEKQLLEQFLKYQDQAFAKMQMNQTPSYELKKMADILMSTKNLKKVEAKRVWEGMKDELSNNPGWKNQISSDVANELEKALSDSNPENWSYVMDVITKADSKALSNWEAVTKIFKESDNRIQRIVNFVSFGDARTRKEIIQVLQKTGVKGYVGARILAYWVYAPVLFTGLSIAYNAFILKGIENIGSKLDKDWEFTEWGDGETIAQDIYNLFLGSFPGETVGDAIFKFLTPSMLDDIWGWISSVFLPGNIFLTEEEIKRKQNEVLDELDPEDREEVRDVLENGSEGEESSTETETSTEEQPLTFDPVLKDIFARYPCMKANFKNGDMKKISDTEFTIMGNGSKWTINIINGNPFYTKQNGVSLKSAYGKDRIPVQCQE